MNSEEKSQQPENALLSCSLCSQSCTVVPVCEKPGIIQLSFSETDCDCIEKVREHLTLCNAHFCSKEDTCPIPVTISIDTCKCLDVIPPSRTCASEEEETPDHKCCFNPYSEPNSQSVQPSCDFSDPNDPSSGPCSESCRSCISRSLVKPQIPYIEPRLRDHIPQSVDELKASISGLTGLEKSPPGNLLGCEFVEYLCGIHDTGPCKEKDSCCENPKDTNACEPKVSHTSNSGCKDRLKYGFSLTMEPKDHKFCTNPDTCIHSRESCPPPPSPAAPCPNSKEECECVDPDEEPDDSSSCR